MSTKITKTTKPKRDLAVRIKLLIGLGIKLTQIAEISGVSYTSLHRFIYAKDIGLTDETKAKVSANLGTWVKRIGAV